MDIYFVCKTAPTATPIGQKWTYDNLIANGYRIENGKIADVAFSVNSKGFMSLELTIKGDFWGVVFSSCPLRKGSLNSPKANGAENSSQIISKILQTVGVDDLMKLKGQYVRVADKAGCPVQIIGHIVDDMWFYSSDYIN